VPGRLFERLEKRVERLLGQHVDLIDDVELELRRRRGVFDRVAQLADFFDAAVAGAVDFNHIQRPAFGNFKATGVIVVEVDLRSAGAIEALGENAGDRGLARAARPAKEVGMGDTALLDGIGKRLRDVLLSDHIAEPLRPILSRDDLIGHL